MSEKKRSTYKRGSLADLPSHVDKSKYGYRWINAERLHENSDGYEPRGFELDKTAEGKVTRRGDLILGRMPIDMHNAMRDQKDEERKSQLELLFQKQAAQEDKDSHEFKKKGGRVKFEFKQE
jgi:hypothetical protein